MIHWSLIVAAETVEQKASLFGFDATLPIIVIEFLILMTVLKGLFFGPLTKAIDNRNDYVRSTLADAKVKLAESEALAEHYKQELVQTRIKSQTIIADAQAAANDIRNRKVIEAQQIAQTNVEKARQEVEQDRAAAQQSLNDEISRLSDQIATKLLGAV